MIEFILAIVVVNLAIIDWRLVKAHNAKNKTALPEWKPAPLVTPFQRGERVVVRSNCFNAGAHGVIEYQEPNGRCWVLRDQASSAIWYLSHELELENYTAQ